MKALKIIGLIVLAVVILLLIAGLFLPADVSIKSEIRVQSSPEFPFNQVNNMENRAKWSPFIKDVSEMEVTYEGSGAGAFQKWLYHGDTGSLTIIASIPYESIQTKIDFMRDTEVKGEWSFTDNDQGTLITWSINFSKLSYPIGRYMGTFMPGRIKNTMNQGLINIKNIVENSPSTPNLQE